MDSATLLSSHQPRIHAFTIHALRKTRNELLGFSEVILFYVMKNWTKREQHYGYRDITDIDVLINCQSSISHPYMPIQVFVLKLHVPLHESPCFLGDRVPV